jgi:hemerythrin-like domain-containing protein
MKSTIISETMVKSHGKILKLLIDFEKSIDQNEKTRMKAFNTFLWELEKHLFTEEKAIFTAYEPEDEYEGYAMIRELIKEHEEIFDKLKEMKKSFKQKKEFDFQGFKKLLMKHKDFEDNKVYPKFDQELDEEDKRIIIFRINDIQLSDSVLSNISVKCSECGKRLGSLEGYYHKEMFGKRWLFCTECYNRVEAKGFPLVKKIEE